MYQCRICNLPIFEGAAGYVVPQCKCFRQPPPFHQYTPNPLDARPGTAPVLPLTEADVRRIVREELKASTTRKPGNAASLAGGEES